MVEQNIAVHRALKESRELLSARQVELHRVDAFDYLRAHGDSFDVVFLDPPFGQGWLPKLLPLLAPRLAADARAYLESEQPLETMPPGFEVLRRSRAGQVHGLLLKYQPP